MLTKAIPFLRAAPRLQHIRSMGGEVPAHWKPIRQICEENRTHMNCMPVPEGSWQKAHSAKMSKYNLTLASSIVAVTLTFALLWKSGCIYFHGPPPAYTNRGKK